MVYWYDPKTEQTCEAFAMDEDEANEYADRLEAEGMEAVRIISQEMIDLAEYYGSAE